MNDDLEEIWEIHSVQRTILEGKLNWRRSVSENQKSRKRQNRISMRQSLQVESEENQNRMVLLQLWDSTGDLAFMQALWIAFKKDSTQ